MHKTNTVISLIIDQGLLPLYFHPDKDISIQVLRALYNAGVKTVEYTNRGEMALENFLQLRSVADKELPGLQIGIGTIKNAKEAMRFINAGADFIICPGVIEEVAEVSHRNSITWIPGCVTATEIIRAENLGAKLVKLYPGSLLGPSYVAAVKEIFPNLFFMPTGGVQLEKEDLFAWFKSGVAAVGIGNKLITKLVLENKDFIKITDITKGALTTIHNIKKAFSYQTSDQNICCH